MNILFIGTTGIHHPLVAAHLYLGCRQPDLRRLQLWGDQASEQRGNPLYLGHDAAGNRVYTLGVGRDVLMVQSSIKQLVEILGYTEADLQVKAIRIRTEQIFPWLLKLLGFKIIKKPIEDLIIYLLNMEISRIESQAGEFTNEARYLQ